jgi:hypothetical protein
VRNPAVYRRQAEDPSPLLTTGRIFCFILEQNVPEKYRFCFFMYQNDTDRVPFFAGSFWMVEPVIIQACGGLGKGLTHCSSRDIVGPAGRSTPGTRRVGAKSAVEAHPIIDPFFERTQCH